MNDLLSLLMGAMDEDGSQMTPKQLRDETMTLFLAGHETTAQMLAWTWYVLGENPAAEARLHEELRGVLGGRPPEAADFAQAALSTGGDERSPAPLSARVHHWRELRSSRARSAATNFGRGRRCLFRSG